MPTIVDALRALNAYPIPVTALMLIAESRGLSVSTPISTEVMTKSAYMLAEADVYMWLADAPDVSQGGQSYSFSEDQRKCFRMRATAIYDRENSATKRTTIYGYKGSRL